jgi:hypothetical protein
MSEEVEQREMDNATKLAQERRAQRKLTAGRLREVLAYFPTTGRFRWRMRRTRGGKGEAGTDRPGGYRRIQIDGVFHYSHRLVWLYVHGKHPTGEIDHRNGNPADNRIANLRQCPHTENIWNAVRRNISGTTGLTRRGCKWQARITVNGRRYNLGSYDSRKEAAAAYRCAARLLREKFARNARARKERSLQRTS